MINKSEMKKFVEWVHSVDYAWDIPDDYADKQFWNIVDDDRNGLEEVLSEMDADHLADISGLFDDMYAKWSDRKMEDLIRKFRKKITDAGLQP